MTTITIDDKLALRLRALREENDDFNQVVADALTETARRWEREAAGRAEMKRILCRQPRMSRRKPPSRQSFCFAF